MKEFSKYFASALILLDFVLLHYIVSSIPLRVDFTEENLYTLSDGTETLIEKIENPVTLDFYTSRSIADLPAGFKTFMGRVEQMLKQYERASGGLLKLNIIDPQPDTPEEEQATTAGLHGETLPTAETVFLGLVASQGDTEKVIPFFDPSKEDSLEYDISKLIYETQQFAKTKLGLITSLPLQAPPYPSMPGQPQQNDQHFLEQLDTNYDIEMIETTASSLPNDIEMLCIVHAQDLSAGLLYEIDQFALSGKPVFLAVDAASLSMRQQMQQMSAMMGQQQQDHSSDLPGILAAWGIEYNRSQVVVDPEIGLAQGQQVQPSWLIIDDAATNREILPAAEVQQALVLLEAGALKISPEATTHWDPVITASSEAGLVSSMVMQYSDPSRLLKNLSPSEETIYIAGLLSGEAKSAYPDGDPKSEENAEADTHLDNGEVSVFIISDTDWLIDQYSIQRINFLGMSSIRALNGNQLFAANFMDYLAGSQDLISIRSKGKKERMFTVVQDMQKEAQKVYQAKLDELEEELSEINARLNELLSEHRGGGTIILTPEMQAVIDDNREQQALRKAERREIRRELRQGIERLGYTVGAINLLWAPFFLVVFGTFFGRVRRNS